MASYSIATSKDTLSALIDKAVAGEDVVITKRGKATAKLVPFDSPRARNLRAATELLRQRLANQPLIEIPVERFYEWLYEDEES